MERTLIGNGRTADVYEYDQFTIIKLFKKSMNPASVQNEYKIAQFAFSCNVSTPKPISFIQENDKIGIVYEKVNGITMLNKLLQNPLQISQIAKNMARLHYSINCIEYENENYNQKKYLKDCIQNTQLIDDGKKEIILKYLGTLPNGTRLCHGDFHPDNILLTNKMWIIDWMTGTNGDQAGDVARTKMILECSDIPNSMPVIVKKLLKLGQNYLAK